MEEIRLWNVNGDKLQLIRSQDLDSGKRLENWLVKDISILSQDLLLITRNAKTDTGQQIDLLAMDCFGEMLIVIQNKDKSFSQVTAQMLDCASWVSELEAHDIRGLLAVNDDLETVFNERWPRIPFPKEINMSHRMLIVGTDIDNTTRRVIEYLVSEYGVMINAVCFSFFIDGSGREFVTENYLFQEDELEQSRSKSRMQRRRKPDVINRLLDSGILDIGDILIFKPAVEQGFNKNDIRITAQIITNAQNCLQSADDSDVLYSLSRLRRKLITELKLEDVNPEWVFGVRYDWMTIHGKTLAFLLEELGE